jgi:hypothetical protein
MFPEAHLPKHALLLQLLIQKAQSLINIVIPHQNLQAQLLCNRLDHSYADGRSLALLRHATQG